MAYLPNSDFTIKDGGNLDAFGKLRVSFPYTLFESKFISGFISNKWSNAISGSTVTIDINNSLVNLEITGGTGSYAIHQSIQRSTYQAGKSQLGLLTFVMSSGSSLVQRVGLFENDVTSPIPPYEPYNGIFLEKSGNTISICVANNGVINRVTQSEWNMDRLDGLGGTGNTSQINLDLTKSQIFLMDYEWLGVGRVRVGFNINGITYYTHEFLHANNIVGVYMKSPSLPIRYEIRSIGGTGTLKQICSSVISEGGRDISGEAKIINAPYKSLTTNGTFADATNYTPIAAIRHQANYPYSFIDKEKFSILTEGTSLLKWSIALVPPETIIALNVGGNTPIENIIFTPILNTSIETYYFDIADRITQEDYAQYIVDEGYIADADKSGSISLEQVDNIISLGEEIDGGRWVFLCAVQSYGTNNIRTSIKFNERL